jgi:hypothetical protein
MAPERRARLRELGDALSDITTMAVQEVFYGRFVDRLTRGIAARVTLRVRAFQRPRRY